MKRMNEKELYVIEVIKSWYGPCKTKHHLSDYNYNPVTFATQEAARAEVDRLDQTVYELSHNESSRPVYTVKPLNP